MLKFDTANSVHWGLAWRERLVCTKCDYVGKYFNVYEGGEYMPTLKKGWKPAKINRGLQTGLMCVPMGIKGFNEILVV